MVHLINSLLTERLIVYILPITILFFCSDFLFLVRRSFREEGIREGNNILSNELDGTRTLTETKSEETSGR